MITRARVPRHLGIPNRRSRTADRAPIKYLLAQSLTMATACELCGMFFETGDQLKIHRARYCQGSALHKAMLATQEESCRSCWA